MKLENKFILFTTFFLLISALILTVLSYFFLIKGFEGIETVHALKDVGRFDALLQERINSLDLTVRDWAYWDDSYNFIENLGKEYVSSNINLDSLANLKLDYILFMNEKEEVVISKRIDYELEELVEDRKIYEVLISKKEIFNGFNENNDSLTGLITVNSDIVFFSLREIYKSDQTGEGKGFLLMAKILNKERLKEMEEILLYSINLTKGIPFKGLRKGVFTAKLTVYIVNSNPSTQKNLHGFNIEEEMEKLEVFYFDESSIFIQKSITDIFNKNIGSVDILIDREIYGFLRRIYILFIILLGSAFSLLSLLIFFFAKKLLKDTKAQLKDLRNSTEGIIKGDIHELNISKGEKEIRDLSISFNKMSKELISSRKSLELQKANLEVEVENKTKDLKEKIKEIQKTKEAILNMMDDINIANQELKLADKTKSEFLNMVSHELKTPLTAIIAHLGVLEDITRDLTAQESESLEAIKRNSLSLKTLISNILEISRIEAGKFELTKIPLELNKLIEDSIKNLEILAKQKSLVLNFENKGPLRVEADDSRLQEVINNLITNAIKFTDKGSINIWTEANKDTVRVYVRDTGIGIPLDKQKNLFQKFYQVDASISRRYGGTGLGLSITKKIIEAHGGTIDFKSKEGDGTTFFFEIPKKTKEPMEEKLNKKDLKAGDPFSVFDSRIKEIIIQNNVEKSLERSSKK
jgi:signal transduction histidine kinase/sensor domain CHASE-containing protein